LKLCVVKISIASKNSLPLMCSSILLVLKPICLHEKEVGWKYHYELVLMGEFFYSWNLQSSKVL